MRRTHAALLRRCGSKRVKFTARIEPKEDNIWDGNYFKCLTMLTCLAALFSSLCLSLAALFSSFLLRFLASSSSETLGEWTSLLAANELLISLSISLPLDWPPRGSPGLPARLPSIWRRSFLSGTSFFGALPPHTLPSKPGYAFHFHRTRPKNGDKKRNKVSVASTRSTHGFA